MGKKKKPCKRLPKLLKPLLLLTPLMLAGCSALSKADACAVFAPISPLETDDAYTIEQIDNHNLRYDALCDE